MFSFLKSLFSSYEPKSAIGNTSDIHACELGDINPANGLPMIGGCIDVEGNPYGTNSDSLFDTDFGYGGNDPFSHDL